MQLKQICKDVREDIVTEIGTLGVGHIGGCLSIVEVLVLLYFKHMNIDPARPDMPGRDRLVISKGHAGPAAYAVLANRGYFPKSELLTLNKNGTNLPSHCDMNKTPGIDMTAGSLGQGFSCAVGIAVGSKLRKDGATVYAVLGDGESQEGQIWEAAMYAGAKKLNNLIAFTDYNGMQIDGTTDEICTLNPLDKKWKAFNWNVITVEDGHDLDLIDGAISAAKKSRKPTMIILKTVKGKGVSFAEQAKVGSHSMSVSKEQMAAAVEEIRRA